MKQEVEMQRLVCQIQVLNDKIDVLLNRINEQAITIQKINDKVNPKKLKKPTLKESTNYRLEKSIARYITK